MSQTTSLRSPATAHLDKVKADFGMFFRRAGSMSDVGRTISICSSFLFEQLPDTENAIHEEVRDAAQLLIVLQRILAAAQDASVHVPYEQHSLQQWHSQLSGC